MAVMTILARHAEDGAQDVVGYHRHQHYLAVQSRWKSFYRAHSRDAWGQHYETVAEAAAADCAQSVLSAHPTVACKVDVGLVIRLAAQVPCRGTHSGVYARRDSSSNVDVAQTLADGPASRHDHDWQRAPYGALPRGH